MDWSRKLLMMSWQSMKMSDDVGKCLIKVIF